MTSAATKPFRMSNPDYSITPGTGRGLLTYYALAFGLAWLVWIPLALASWGWLPLPLPPALAWLAGLAPIFAGTYQLYREQGWAGVRLLVIRCGLWRFHWRWYAVALCLPIAMIGLDLAVYRLLGGALVGTPPEQWLATYLPTFLLLTPLAIFEEAGWRGYASPRLQHRFGKWGASWVLGSLWGVWHLPYYLIRGVSFFADFPLPTLVQALFFFVLGTIAFETLMTWLFRHTRGSLLFACLFHASNNAFANLTFVPTAQASQGQSLIASAVVGWVVALVILQLDASA